MKEYVDAEEYLCQLRIMVVSSLHQIPPKIEGRSAKFLELKCADPVDLDVRGVVNAEETDVSAIPRGVPCLGRVAGACSVAPDMLRVGCGSSLVA